MANKEPPMPRRQMTLARVKSEYPDELDYCSGYVWHQRSVLGTGAYGEVYQGWTSDGSQEVAVKVVNTRSFKQNPKLEENLKREIKILELLRGCEHVVHLHHVQWMENQVVLVMELCPLGDLHKLLKWKQFTERDVTIFLYQFTQGIKALREQNIVHRDLKPGNILIKIHPTTGKMVIKLADFGFARHFMDENNKPIDDMQTVAGTLAFMAPEAQGRYYEPGQSKSGYDDKVDIWSIGALLYNVIVGHSGFSAELGIIAYNALKKKGDAIAITKNPKSKETKLNYIYELPPSVNERLSRPFKEKMDKMLQAMLKVNPVERMTFSDFENAVDDLYTSKVTVVNLLHGTSLKVINDSQLIVESLVEEVASYTHVPRQYQVLFSTKSQHFISPQSALSEEQFRTLLDESGGSQGHAKLYLLPVNLVESDSLQPDYSCLAGFMIDDEVLCVSKIKKQKFSNEMVQMIKNMNSEQRAQLEGLEEFQKFVSMENIRFNNNCYKQLTEMGHQALAKANLVIQWLQQDQSSLPDKNHGQFGTHLQAVNQHRAVVKKYVQQLNAFKCAADLANDIDVEEKDILVEMKALIAMIQDLPKFDEMYIHEASKTIYEKCQKFVSEVTVKVKSQLRPLWSRLSEVWTLNQMFDGLHRACNDLDTVLEQLSSLLRSALGLPKAQSDKQTAPLESSSNGPSLDPYPLLSSAVTEGEQDDLVISTVEAVKKENEDLRHQIERLTSMLKNLKTPCCHDEERTITPNAETTTVPHSLSDDAERTLRTDLEPITEESRHGLEKLTHFLEKCSTSTEKLKSVVTAQVSCVPSKSDEEDTVLFPSFKELSDQASDRESTALLPKALKLSENLQVVLEGLVETSTRGGLTFFANSGLVKIAHPSEYQEGDLVLFHSVKCVSTDIGRKYSILHLERKRPYMLMDDTCYSSFSIRAGRTPDLILGKLTEKPIELKFEDSTLAKDLSCTTSDSFFRVKAEATELKFSVPHSIPTRTFRNLSTTSETSDRGPGTTLGLLNRQDESGYV